MGFDDIKKTVTDKVNEVLPNEEQTDSALDKASELANKATGDKFADKVQQGRDFVDGKVGDENA